MDGDQVVYDAAGPVAGYVEGVGVWKASTAFRGMRNEWPMRRAVSSPECTIR
jgi:hypothetical protein